ncbi:HlyD family secretion protein [Daejeonella sp.]|jgi:multidrug resistance efflux pump|uniref:HlyD family secretion protein n=1 Tax=Daejeonella sp. TaxID=2805397 RepID=UPI0037BE4B16
MFLDKKTDLTNFSKFKSFVVTAAPTKRLRKTKWMLIILGALIAALLLPWTQNIRSRGNVSTLNPEQRPQEVNSFISARISKWYIQNGNFVKKGDTLLALAETKDEYLDPELLKRTTEQLDAKSQSADFYRNKVNTSLQQISALEEGLELKLSQLKIKLRQYTLQVQSDSMAMTAAAGQFKIASVQVQRQEELFKAGLKSLVELEARQQYFQDALAKKIGTENKYQNSKNELVNIRLEFSSASQEYSEKISKAAGDKYAALSEVATSDGEASKLRNVLFNYSARKSFHYIIAPQDGQVLQSGKAGIGETVKDGEKLLTIVPAQLNQAIEIKVDPNDMPLINLGQLVRIQFDGFPAIIFSGWPQASYGLFSGRISAIDNTIDESGKFKVWVIPEQDDKKWPQNLRYGTGCQAIALLDDVPIWYELWRQFNGFPPNFYNPKSKDIKSKK